MIYLVLKPKNETKKFYHAIEKILVQKWVHFQKNVCYIRYRGFLDSTDIWTKLNPTIVKTTLIWVWFSSKTQKWGKSKEYFPNLLETWFWGQIFVYWATSSNFGYMLIFLFSWTMQSLRKIGNICVTHFTRVPPFDVFCFFNLPKVQWGTLVKCVTQMLSDLSQTLHSSGK